METVVDQPLAHVARLHAILRLQPVAEDNLMQRARLERDAELLGPKAAGEPALLDEQARSLLDLAHPADIVIVNGLQAAR